MNLTHVNESGKAAMVDISGKSINERSAGAKAKVYLNEKAYNAVKNNEILKGDVLAVAKIGAIQAAKKTSELIPLCHNIFISHIDVDFQLNDNERSISIESHAKTNSSTGIEMEALTTAATAGLIIYDMCKALDKSIVISDIALTYKTGGKSGDYNIYKKIN